MQIINDTCFSDLKVYPSGYKQVQAILQNKTEL